MNQPYWFLHFFSFRRLLVRPSQVTTKREGQSARPQLYAIYNPPNTPYLFHNLFTLTYKAIGSAVMWQNASLGRQKKFFFLKVGQTRFFIILNSFWEKKILTIFFCSLGFLWPHNFLKRLQNRFPLFCSIFDENFFSFVSRPSQVCCLSSCSIQHILTKLP